MIILIGNQKGGCGKTTIAVNLAAALVKKDKDVILFDADKQVSASEWVANRNKYQPDAKRIHIGMGYDDISSTLRDLNKRYEIVLVDPAGRDSNEFRTGMMAANMLIIPVKPSAVDLTVLPSVQQLVKQVKFINESLKVYAMINIAPTHAKNQETDQAKSVIAKCKDFVQLNTIIHDRKCFRDSFADGLGVVEQSGGGNSDAASRDEIESLVEEILNGC